MNCLTEALGFSLPGNGTLLATHAERKELFLKAGRKSSNFAIVTMKATIILFCRAASAHSRPLKTP